MLSFGLRVDDSGNMKKNQEWIDAGCVCFAVGNVCENDDDIGGEYETVKSRIGCQLMYASYQNKKK